MKLELAQVGAATLKQGSPRWQCSIPIANDNDDTSNFGEVAVIQSLGVTSIPEGRDDSGGAEAVIATQVGNKRAIALGGRDTRDADIVGKLDPGDTVIHATGKGKKPQIQVKKKKRSASMVVPCEDGTDALLTVDGKGHKFQFLGWKLCIQASKRDGILLSDGKGGGIQIADGEVTIMGNLRVAGMAPGHFIVTAPIAGIPVPGVTTGMGATLAPFTPLNGVGGTR